MIASGNDIQPSADERAPGPEDFRKALGLRDRILAYGLEDGLFELMIGLTLLVMAGHRYLYHSGHRSLDYFIAGLYIVLIPILMWLAVKFRSRREKIKGSIVERFGPVLSRFGLFVLAAILGMNLYRSNNNFFGTGVPDSTIGVHLAAAVWIIACLLMRNRRFLVYAGWAVVSYIVALAISMNVDFGGATQRFQIFGMLTSLPPLVYGAVVLVKHIADNLYSGDDIHPDNETGEVE